MKFFFKRVFKKLPFTIRFRIKNIISSNKAEMLYRRIPLKVPFSIHIDPTNLCNFKCKFCPTGDEELLRRIKRPKGMMPIELYKKIIDDFEILVNKHNTRISKFHIYKDGEPLLHQNLCEMISYTKSKKIAESIETTTNAALLNKELSEKILTSGLDRIRISIEHVNDDKYKEITQIFSDYTKIKENVKKLYLLKEKIGSKLHIHVKIIDVNLTDKEKKAFINDFTCISDTINIDQLMGWGQSDLKDFTLGSDVSKDMTGKVNLFDRKVCSEPFTSLSINFDGSVSVCCVDWLHGTIVGDARKESIEEIWNGKKLLEFRLKHLNFERFNMPVCSDCQYNSGFPEEMYLDLFAKKVIKLIK